MRICKQDDKCEFETFAPNEEKVFPNCSQLRFKIRWFVTFHDIDANQRYWYNKQFALEYIAKKTNIAAVRLQHDKWNKNVGASVTVNTYSEDYSKSVICSGLWIRTISTRASKRLV